MYTISSGSLWYKCNLRGEIELLGYAEKQKSEVALVDAKKNLVPTLVQGKLAERSCRTWVGWPA